MSAATIDSDRPYASLVLSTISASPASVAKGGPTSTITVQLKNSAGVNMTRGGYNVVISDDTGPLATTDNGDGTYTAVVGPRS